MKNKNIYLVVAILLVVGLFMTVYIINSQNRKPSKNITFGENLKTMKRLNSAFGFSINIPEGWHILQYTYLGDLKIKLIDKYNPKNINGYEFNVKEFNDLKNNWSINNSENVFIVKNSKLSGREIYKKLNFANDQNLIWISVNSSIPKLVNFKNNTREGKIITLDNGQKAQYLNIKDTSKMITIPLKKEKEMFNGNVARGVSFSISSRSLMRGEEFINWIKKINLE